MNKFIDILYFSEQGIWENGILLSFGTWHELSNFGDFAKPITVAIVRKKDGKVSHFRLENIKIDTPVNTSI